MFLANQVFTGDLPATSGGQAERIAHAELWLAASINRRISFEFTRSQNVWDVTSPGGGDLPITAAETFHRRTPIVRILFFALASILLITSAPLAASADADSFSRPGGYVGISGVYQNNIFENRLEDLLQDALSPVPVALSIEDSGGLGAVVGYRLASFFAAELQYEWVDEYSVSAGVTGFGSGEIFSLSGHTLTANTKFILPIWRIQPYALLGVGFSSWKADRGPLAPVIEALDPEVDIDSGKQFGLAGRVGVGMDLYITRNFLINAQGQVVLTTLKKPDLADIDGYNYLGFTVGLQYRF